MVTVGKNARPVRRDGPMYQQVRQDLLARIRRGEFPPGSLLPSENQICEQYGVSVTTARRAFLELVKEGVVRRRAGVGTMVASRIRRARIAFVSIDYTGDAWRHIPSVIGEMFAGIGEHAWRRDAVLEIVGVEDEEAEGYLRRVAERRPVDGLLLRVANDIRGEHLDVLERAGVPYVLIKRHIPGRRMNCVISDDVTGARIATAHLLELGHRRIGFVCGKPHLMLNRERLAGYRKALEEYGVGFDEGLVRHEDHFTTEMGYRAVRSLLERPPRPSAVFVASDTMALGGYEAVWDLGLRIPEDVSIVGYDDIQAASALQPPLTTVRTSYYDFGRLAAQLLLDLIEGREVAPQRRVIHPTLVLRGSTRRLSPGREMGRDATPQPHQQPPPSGRLSGLGLLCSGLEPALRQEVVQACAAEGALPLAGEETPPELWVQGLSLWQDLGTNLRRALERGRMALRRMREGGTLVYVASAMSPDPSLGGIEHEAVRAGLERVVRVLAAEGAARGVRVNALLCLADRHELQTERAAEVAGTVAFLASAAARSISGETLTLDGAP
ncbi:HTH-type transcriptional repressor PurR [Rubrobacter xylanophilus DSM 9941]|nr:HTH-type transcriptional repressor PurR [Rubrobacter xylanophilus DSM 9941]